MTKPINTAARVKAARLMLGMTQAELGEALRLRGDTNGKDTVRSWEAGRREISGPAQVAIEMLLEVRGLSIDNAVGASFDRIMRAIVDPGAVVGTRWQEETLPNWQTRAVQTAIRSPLQPA